MLNEEDIIKKVKQIEIKTRGIVNELFSGEYHSAFKGRGINFSEVREYSYGDEIRDIDWKVTARARKPFIKIFEEDRELILMLMVDISKSGSFGSIDKFKKDIAVEIGAVLAFSAIKNNDKVGLILFSDKIEKFIPPKKGKSHVFRIIRELIYHEPKHDKTSIKSGLEYFNKVMNKKSIAFLISDFFDTDYEKEIQIVSKKHDLIAIDLFDEKEKNIPFNGLCDFYDSESKSVITIDFSSEENRKLFLDERREFMENKFRILKKNKIDTVEIDINSSYVRPLMTFFKKRMRKVH